MLHRSKGSTLPVLTLAATIGLVSVSWAQAEVVIESVVVGNPGNAGEWSGEGAGGTGPDRVCGAVDYIYEIGRFEVTAGQYRDFLNAVDPAGSNPYGLYRSTMDTDPFGCQITWNAGSSTYDFSGRPSGTEADWVDRPVNYVSWADAARFANWLHNGQPTGQLTGDPAQDAGLTEDGSYYLNGATTDGELITIVREDDATWVIPSEDEWYKAAYHYNDGVTGNYWDYPTASDTAPTSEAPPGTDMTNGSANYWWDGDFAIGSPYYRTEVGAYDAKPSDSPYDTFDQAGNVWEHNEAVLHGTHRGARGGSFDFSLVSVNYLHAAYRDYGFTPTDEYLNIGVKP